VDIAGDSRGLVLIGVERQVVWDPYAYEQSQGAVPLAAAEYTLRINDERGPQAPIKGGYLTPYSGTKFSLYRPQEYTPLESEFSCSIFRKSDANWDE
jgi:hypothetical protein